MINLTCRRCKTTEHRIVPQMFKDGTRHRRVECVRCGKFLRYAPRRKVAPHRISKAEAALAAMEEALIRRVIKDATLSHVDAGVVSDHVLDAAYEVRRQFGLAQEVSQS
jgi:hypothetical protein